MYFLYIRYNSPSSSSKLTYYIWPTALTSKTLAVLPRPYVRLALLHCTKVSVVVSKIFCWSLLRFPSCNALGQVSYMPRAPLVFLLTTTLPRCQVSSRALIFATHLRHPRDFTSPTSRRGALYLYIFLTPSYSVNVSHGCASLGNRFRTPPLEYNAVYTTRNYRVDWTGFVYSRAKWHATTITIAQPFN